MDREQILQRFDQEVDRLAAASALDRIALLEKTGQPQCSDFLDPHLARTAERVMNLFKTFKYISWGGYEGAERVRHLIFPSVRQARTADVPLTFIEVKTAAEPGELSHRDYLGAVLGLGLRREKLGDIIVTEAGPAQLVTAPEIADFVLANLTKVGNCGTSLRLIQAAELCPSPPRQKEIRATVASLRLDSVASAGFGISRSKLAPAIRAGQVKLNWQSVKNASSLVKAGDVIALAGRGRLELAAVTGESKKGRLQIILKKQI